MHKGRWSDGDALLVAAGRGDVDALGAFYDATAPVVFGLLRRVVGDVEEAARATSRVYLDLWRAAPRFEPDDRSAYALLLHLARREVVGRLGDIAGASPARRPGCVHSTGTPPASPATRDRAR